MNLIEKIKEAKMRGYRLRIFRDEQRLREYFEKGNPLPQKTNLSDLLEHERAHYNKARELGVKTVYAICYKEGDNIPLVVGLIPFEDDSLIPNKIKEEIILVPKNISYGDSLLLSKLKVVEALRK